MGPERLSCSRPRQRKYRQWCSEQAQAQRSDRDDSVAAVLEFRSVRAFGSELESMAATAVSRGKCNELDTLVKKSITPT